MCMRVSRGAEGRRGGVRVCVCAGERAFDSLCVCVCLCVSVCSLCICLSACQSVYPCVCQCLCLVACPRACLNWHVFANCMYK